MLERKIRKMVTMHDEEYSLMRFLKSTCKVGIETANNVS